MWSSWGGGLRRFAIHMRYGRGCRRDCGPQRRSWRGGTGSKLRRRRWMLIDRAFRRGRIDSSLAREQSRISLDASVRPEERPLQRALDLLAGTTGVGASCLVEVESARGAKLRLELKAIPTSDLAEL